MSENPKIIAIVDDHPIVVDGLKSLLQSVNKYEVISFFNGKSVIEAFQTQKIDIILLDIVLPDGNGVDFCKEIKTLNPDTIIIGFSNQAEQSTINAMLQNGASGFILKSAPSEEILDGIEEAAKGKMILNDEIRKLMFETSKNEFPSITKREKQLIELLAQGKTTAIIADELFLSRFTVDTYRKNLLQKFDVKNTSELLMLLVQNKMI